MAKPVKKKAAKKKVKKPADPIKLRIARGEAKLIATRDKLEAEIKALNSRIRAVERLNTRIAELERQLGVLKRKERISGKKADRAMRKAKGFVDSLNQLKQYHVKEIRDIKQFVNSKVDEIEAELTNLHTALTKIASMKVPVVTSAQGTGGKNPQVPPETVAYDVVKLYFEEIARLGFKRSLDLDSIINAYFYTLEKLRQGEGLELTSKQAEPMQKMVEAKIEEIKKPVIGKERLSLEEKGFSYTNKKGVRYYLHKRGKLYYFSKDPLGAVDLPENMYVVESPKTGLPMVKKRK
jgi:prefoldin subunit 5